jgi:hypothetical protein
LAYKYTPPFNSDSNGSRIGESHPQFEHTLNSLQAVKRVKAGAAMPQSDFAAFANVSTSFHFLPSVLVVSSIEVFESIALSTLAGEI